MKPKFFLYLFFTVALLIVAVMGWHWSDVADTKFWWVFWEVASYISIVALIIMWVIAWTGQNKKR